MKDQKAKMEVVEEGGRETARGSGIEVQEERPRARYERSSDKVVRASIVRYRCTSTEYCSGICRV